MAISVSWIYQVKPGRMDDFTEMMRRGRDAAREDGVRPATAQRLWNVIVGGPAIGMVFHQVDRDSLADLATANEQPNPNLQALFNELTGPDGPADLSARNVQVILSEAGDFNGNISWHTVGLAKPGRLDEFTDRLDEINEHLLASGGSGVRHTRNAIGGPATGNLNSRATYDDLASWAASREALAQNEAWQQLISGLLAPDGPVTQTASLLQEQIRL